MVATDVRVSSVLALAEELAERFAARAERYDRENSFPWENFADLRDSGYLALTIPKEFGGGGIDPLTFTQAQERIARGCASTALGATMHMALLGRLGDLRSWPDAEYRRVVNDAIQHGMLINAVNSEPDLGSPSRGGLPSTTAVRTAGGWVVNGRKRWATLAPALGYAHALVALIDGDAPPERASLLIPMQTPGVRVEETWDNLGMRATASHDVVFEDVLVPLDARVPTGPTGVPGDGQGWYTFPLAAISLGIAVAARDAAVTFARERRPNGMSGPIAELQTIQHRIAEIELLNLQSRSVLYSTAERWFTHPDERLGLAPQLAAVKYLTSNNAIRVTDLALRVTGSAGLARGMPVERYFRDVRTMLGHPPMDDAALTLIGKSALGLN